MQLCPDNIKHPILCSLRKTSIRPPDKKRVLFHGAHVVHGTYLSAAFLHGSGIEAYACGALLLLLVANYFIHFDQEPTI